MPINVFYSDQLSTMGVYEFEGLRAFMALVYGTHVPYKGAMRHFYEVIWPHTGSDMTQ